MLVEIDIKSVKEGYGTLLQHCFRKRQRLAETSLGYIGMFPLHVRPGDIICVVNGLRHLAVLRRVAEDYAFVGTCVVQGLASTEQVRQLVEEKGTRVETVVIR